MSLLLPRRAHTQRAVSVLSVWGAAETRSRGGGAVGGRKFVEACGWSGSEWRTRGDGAAVQVSRSLRWIAGVVSLAVEGVTNADGARQVRWRTMMMIKRQKQ